MKTPDWPNTHQRTRVTLPLCTTLLAWLDQHQQQRIEARAHARGFAVLPPLSHGDWGSWDEPLLKLHVALCEDPLSCIGPRDP
jgi:hypothetical protein